MSFAPLVKAFVSDLRSDDEEIVAHALDELWNLVMVHQAVSQMSSSASGVLAALRDLLRDSEDRSLQMKILTILYNLSGNYTDHMGSAELDLLPVLVDLMQSQDSTARQVTLSVVWNMSAEFRNVAYLGNAAHGLFPLLKGLCSPSSCSNKKHQAFALNTLSNFAITSEYKEYIGSEEYGLFPVVKQLVLDSEDPQLQARAIGMIWDLCLCYNSIQYLLQSCGDLQFVQDHLSAPLRSELRKNALIALMVVSRHPAAAKVLAGSGLLSLLPPMMLQTQPPVDRMRAAMLMVCIRGSVDEQHATAPGVLAAHPELATLFLSITTNTLSGLGGSGYDFGNFDLCVLMAAACHFSSNAIDRVLLLTAVPQFTAIVGQVIMSFAEESASIPNRQLHNGANVGGGVDDVESAERALQTVMHLVQFDQNDKGEDVVTGADQIILNNIAWVKLLANARQFARINPVLQRAVQDFMLKLDDFVDHDQQIISDNVMEEPTMDSDSENEAMWEGMEETAEELMDLEAEPADEEQDSEDSDSDNSSDAFDN